jgi:Bax protein
MTAKSRVIALAAGLAALLLAAPVMSQSTAADEHVPYRDYKDVLALFDRLGYTAAAWNAGHLDVPPVYLAQIQGEWKEKAKQATVADKKKVFFRILLPIALKVNEFILEDRARATAITERLARGADVSADDQQWLAALAVRYKLTGSSGDRLAASQYPELLLRVDVVPPSLTLAQAASESGWGTSRFASEGNSLFGQWSWGKGLKPTEQRTESVGDQRIAAFDSTFASAVGYALNLNTQRGYQDLRVKRADLRRNNLPISGSALVTTLIHYSERGQAYVNDLTALMKQNRLATADAAQLRQMPVIRLDFVEDKPK